MIKKLITKFIFLLVFIFSGSFCFSQKDTLANFERKILEMRKLRIEREKNNPTQTTNRTTFYADGGLVSFTPKSPNSYITTSINISAGTVPPKIYNYEYATDVCSMAGPSNQITYDGFYEWDVSYDNGVTWQLGVTGQGSSLQLGVVTQSALYRRYCYPWDWQGSITNGCGLFYSNIITINVAVNGGSITTTNQQTNFCSGSSLSFLNQTSATSTNSGTITYQWQEKITGSSVFVDIPNATNDSYNAPNITQNTTFRRKATDALNKTGYSNEVSISVIPNSSLTITNNSNIVSSTGNVVLYSQSIGVINLQWQIENNGVFENIPSATQSNYTASTSGLYRVTGNQQCSNNTIQSNQCTLTILPSSFEFGIGIWRIHGYEGTNSNANLNIYKGFYDNDVPTNPNNFYTQDHWNENTAPSSLAANTPFTTEWYGTTMTNYSSVTVVAKRKGFDCGNYNLSVHVGSFNRLKLIVDGIVIKETYTDATGFFNVYFSSPITLNANSTIEVWTSSSTPGTFINFEARRISGTNLLGGTITPSTQTLTTGATPALLANATNPTGGNGSSYLYQWEQSNQFIGPFTEIANATSNSLQLGTLNQTTYYRRKTYQAGCSYGAYSNVSTITLPQIITITGGSISLNGATNTICSGSSPAIISNETLANNGTGVYTYIWQQSIGNNNQWIDIAGTNSTSYQPPALTVSTKYRRKVTDNLNSTAYSNEISFTVNACFVALSGGTISYNNSTIICANSSLSNFSSTNPASGGSPNYNYIWQIKNSSNNNWYDLPNSSTENYQPSPMSASATFRRKVTDGVGDFAYSNEITLTEASNNVTLNPGSITSNEFVCNTSSNPLLTSIISASGSAVSYGYSYTWEQYQNSNWNAISTPSANADSLQNATLLQPLANTTGLYRRKVTDFCGIYAYSNTATVQLQSLTAGSIFINSTSVTTGQTPSLIVSQIEPSTGTVNNTPAVLEITWLQTTNLNGPWNVISGANSLNYQPFSLIYATYFKRVVKELQCNLSAESNVISITVNSTPTTFNGGIIQAANTCVQNGNSPGLIEPLANNNLGGTAPYTFTWELNVNNTWTMINNATAASYTPSNLFATTSFRRKTTDALNNIAYSNILTINVQFQQLKPGIIGKSVVVCPNINDTFFYEILSACGGYGDLSYQWEMSNSNSTWTILPNSNSANYTLTNITADCKIRRKVFDACGNSAYTNIVDVFIYPAIVGGSISPAEQTVCLNNNPQNLYLLQNYHYTNGNVTYQWQKATNANGPWTNVQNASSAVYIPKVPISIMYYRLQITSSMCNYVGYSSVAVVRGNDFCRTMINATNSAPKKK